MDNRESQVLIVGLSRFVSRTGLNYVSVAG